MPANVDGEDDASATEETEVEEGGEGKEKEGEGPDGSQDEAAQGEKEVKPIRGF